MQRMRFYVNKSRFSHYQIIAVLRQDGDGMLFAIFSVSTAHQDYQCVLVGCPAPATAGDIDDPHSLRSSARPGARG